MASLRISRPRAFALAGLAFCFASACSSQEEPSKPGSSGTGGSGSGQGTPWETGGAQSTGGVQSPGGTNDPLLPAPSCADRELPERSGRLIEVAAAGPGRVTVEGQETTLRAVISSAEEGDTIELATGTYTFDEAEAGGFTGLYVTTPHITIRGASEEPSDVILNSAYVDHGGQSGVISIDAPGVVLAHFTVQASIFHLIHLWEKGDDALVHNVVLQDGGQQFLKASPGSGTVDSVEVSCSRFVMTPEGRANVWGYGGLTGNTRCYTGGIDTHNATNWHIHGSQFEGIYCDTETSRPAHRKKAEDRENMSYSGGLAEHAIHMWDSPEGSAHLIENNHIKDCARGIGLGLREPVYGSIVRNNVITSAFAASGEHDVAISVERGIDTLIAHNTIFASSSDAYPSSIEIRFSVSENVEVAGNLSSHAIRLRDEATATLHNNLENASAAAFVDAPGDDFHLAECSSTREVPAHPQVPTDFDGKERGEPSQAGAYECEK